MTLRFVAGVEFSGLPLLGNKQSIIIANHNSHMDTMAILASLPWSRIDKVHPVAAKEYFAKGPISKFFWTFVLNAVFIERKSGASIEETLKPVTDSLETGHSILMFPEGSRGEPGVRQKVKPGIAHILRSYPDIPIEPMIFEGFELVLPKGSWMIVPSTCSAEVRSVVTLPMGLSENEIKNRIEMLLFDQPLIEESNNSKSRSQKRKSIDRAA